MEYIPHGPLRRFIPKNVGLPIEMVRIYAAQLVVYLEYLHSELEVCHRDLKPGNIMIGDNLYLKIVSLNKGIDHTFYIVPHTNCLINALFCCLNQIDYGDCKALYNCENYNAPFFTGTQEKLQNV